MTLKNETRLHACVYCVSSATTATLTERKLRQDRNVNRKLSGIRLSISGLILIRMSAGSLPKCCGFVALSASAKLL